LSNDSRFGPRFALCYEEVSDDTSLPVTHCQMPENIKSAPATDFRYTIRGLMFLVVFAALGSMLVRYDLSRWYDGLLVVVVCWVLVGIGSQLCDLLRVGCRADSSWNVRGTIVIEFLRRILLALVLLGYLAWIVLRSPGVASDEILRKLSWLEWGMPESLFLLALMSGMLLRGPPRDIVRSCSVRTLRNFFLGTCACVWMYYLYRDRLFSHELVQRALGGVLSRLRFIDVFGDAHDVWVRGCAQSAFTATVAATLAIVFAKILVWRWNGGRSKELFWILPLGLSLAVSGWEVGWAASTGLPNVDPCWSYFGEALSLSAAVDLFMGGILLLLFVTETTLRVGLVEDADADQKIQWRLRPQSYTHERQATLGLLAVTVAGWLVTEIYWRGVENGLIVLQPTAWRTLQASLPRLMLDSATVLKVACMLLAISVLRWQRSSRPPADTPTAPLRLLKFCVVWTSILTITALTIATLLWLYYTVCLMPR
jgi:hypothetical protein